MNTLKKIAEYSAYLLGAIIVYLVITVLLSYISVNNDSVNPNDNKTIYLSTNGIHLSIILPKESVAPKVLDGIQSEQHQNYYMFGWGNEDFYLNTPTWDDFKFKYIFRALFLDTPTAIHVTTYLYKQSDWTVVKCNQQELDKLNEYIFKTFKTDSNLEKQFIPQTMYAKNDSFYKASGSYSVTRTCNTWANDAFKQSGLKASYFTIYDFGLLSKYE